LGDSGRQGYREEAQYLRGSDLLMESMKVRSMSEDIVYDLKEEHRDILDLFTRIDRAENPEEKKGLLSELKALLVEHLHKEDTIIYPTLLQSSDEEIVALGKSFLNVMTGYTRVFLDIADRMIGDVDGMSASSWEEYEAIRDKIKDRVFVEEVALFPVYEKTLSAQEE
jgi:hemerythrin-like domain-containing protein